MYVRCNRGARARYDWPSEARGRRLGASRVLTLGAFASLALDLACRYDETDGGCDHGHGSQHEGEHEAPTG